MEYPPLSGEVSRVNLFSPALHLPPFFAPEKNCAVIAERGECDLITVQALGIYEPSIREMEFLSM